MRSIKLSLKGVPPSLNRFPDNRRRDPDNYSGKMLLDGLTRGGVIVDDSFRHISLMLSSDIDRENPQTEIVVKEV